MDLLQEKHSLQTGNRVLVSLRIGSNESYEGTIYNIINLPMNKGRPDRDFVDYFYIQFPKHVYAKLLLRGSEIIYDGKPCVIGTNGSHENVINYTRQHMFSSNDCSIEPEKINAMLIWRIAYDIQPIY